MRNETNENSTIVKDADPNYWLAIIDGQRIGGFRSEDDAWRFIRAFTGGDVYTMNRWLVIVPHEKIR
jgi:hypothetical protein